MAPLDEDRPRLIAVDRLAQEGARERGAILFGQISRKREHGMSGLFSNNERIRVAAALLHFIQGPGLDLASPRPRDMTQR